MKTSEQVLFADVHGYDLEQAVVSPKKSWGKDSVHCGITTILIPRTYSIQTNMKSCLLLVGLGRLGHGRCRFIRYRVLGWFGHGMNFVDDGSSVDIRRTRLARSL